METQKTMNLLNDSINEKSKFATKDSYFIDSQTAKNKYNQNNSIKFETESIKLSLCNYANALILATGDITINAGNNTAVAFKYCAPFFTFNKEIKNTFIDNAKHICIAMLMYNLIEYSDNYPNTSGSVWQFKRDEVPVNDADLSVKNSQSFKYKAALV